MKKRILLSTCIFLALTFGGKHPVTHAETEEIPQDQFPSVIERAFLRSLGGTILEIMRNHGDQQLFFCERIEKISGDNQYDVTLRVIGFEGAHNPPYKLIRMTIRMPGDKGADYTVVDYTARPISNEEFIELTSYARED